jgi:hypothetical protein
MITFELMILLGTLASGGDIILYEIGGSLLLYRRSSGDEAAAAHGFSNWLLNEWEHLRRRKKSAFRSVETPTKEENLLPVHKTFHQEGV